MTAPDRIKRRDFIRGTASGGLAMLAGLPLVACHHLGGNARADRDDILRGFIVSDAHFGWEGSEQPHPDVQRAAMRQILTKFPDLDLFFDTGDPHHNIAPDSARVDWTDVIANGCGPMPMFYTAGNHDMMAWSTPLDLEWRTARFGNLPAEPYFSFDYKGIHFVSLPQMILMSYNTDDALAWLDLDLALNRDRTVVVLSHNAIKDTTFLKGDVGYRVLANSEDVEAVLDRHPHVIGWMHGHNHDWNVVRRGERLYVSNGRIGGFDPNGDTVGQGHLGGVYFEIGPDHCTVRCYCALHDVWLDAQPGMDFLNQTIEGPTSFDPAAPAAYSYGIGLDRAGRRTPVYHHQAGARRFEVFMTGVVGTTFNDNRDIATYVHRSSPGYTSKHLAALSVAPGLPNEEHEETSWDWEDGRVIIHAVDDPKAWRSLYTPGNAEGRSNYYRTAPGQRYRARIRLADAPAGSQFVVLGHIHDRNLNRVGGVTVVPAFEGSASSTGSGRLTLREGAQVLEAELQMPALDDLETIYTDPASDEVLCLMVEAKFSNIHQPIIIEGFELEFSQAEPITRDPALRINGQRLGRPGTLEQGKVWRFEGDWGDHAPERVVVEPEAGGNRLLTWLLRVGDLEWQVRNAPVAVQADGALLIGPLRNEFSPDGRIMIAPFTRPAGPWVASLSGVNRARILPSRGKGHPLTVELLEIGGKAEVEIAGATDSARIEGAHAAQPNTQGRLEVTTRKPGRILVYP